MESGRYNGLMRISTKYYQRTKRGGPVQACEVTSEGLLAEGKTLKLNLQNKGRVPQARRMEHMSETRETHGERPGGSDGKEQVGP